MKLLLIIFIFMFICESTVNSSPVTSNPENQCGYEACPLTYKDKINVHIIPHSHDDVGWLKTPNQYFTGVSAVVGVEYVISAVVQALKHNSERRFTQVETAFLYKWWQKQPEEKRQDFRNLINNGQIEIAGGGWVMNDEACVTYQSTIHQFTRGLRFLNDTLGPCGAPRVGWQIDPFGHSRQQASIFKLLGFDGAFFPRHDFRERLERMQNRTLDFIWKSSSTLENSEIFYNIMMNHYSNPTGFCWDWECYDDGINDDPDSFDYNVDVKKAQFEKILEEFANYSTTNNLLIPMGGDFTYNAAELWYINMDRLLKIFKNHSTYNVVYSTPSCYVKAINEAAPKLTVKTGDFLPYSSEEYAYWTGFFTSRPNSKRFERTSSNILQASKQLRAIIKLNSKASAILDSDPTLATLQNSVADVQHHDAITGTEKQLVATHYDRQILKGIQKSEESIGLITGSLLSKSIKPYDRLKFTSCLLANISICEISNEDEFLVSVYNPLSKFVDSYIRLPVNKTDFSIIGAHGTLEYDIVESISNFTYVTLRNLEPSPKEIVFLAKDIPPMGINLYYVSNTVDATSKNREKVVDDDELTFGTNLLNFKLNSSTHKLESVTMNNVTLKITQDFYYYLSENGQHNNWASGAYLFRPLKDTKAVEVSDKPGILEYSYKGNSVDEAHVRINEWVKQIIRVYKDGKNNYIEFDWLVGPIDVNETSYIGKEIITRFTVEDFINNGIFYTDSNGREIIKRIRNKREDYTYDATIEPITSNYYPVTSRIVMRDENKNVEVAILNDRSQGGTSLEDGQLEIMVHRRMLVDDYKGVAEALNEIEFNQGMVARGKHLLVFGSIENIDEGKSLVSQQRDLQHKLLLAPYTFVAPGSKEIEKILDFQFEFLSSSLPDNINILTFEKWSDDIEDDIYLLRLEHLYEIGEDSELSQPVTINLENIFTNYNITEIRETTLGANHWLDEFEAKNILKWKSQDEGPTIQKKIDSLEVTLKPMEIRTFVIKINAI